MRWWMLLFGTKPKTDVSHSFTLQPTEMPQMFPVNAHGWGERWEEQQDKPVTWDGSTSSSRPSSKGGINLFRRQTDGKWSFLSRFSIVGSESRRESGLYCGACPLEDVVDRLTRRAAMCCFQVSVQLCGRAEREVCGLNSWHRLGLWIPAEGDCVI